MAVRRLELRGFRNLVPQELELEDGVTLLWGPNGAGKTNVLEALCTALSGRSCRTRNERETIPFRDPLARVEVEVEAGDRHRFRWSLARSGERRHTVDGAAVTAEHAGLRPALSIFLPERLALIKGPPANRRAHLDRFVAALWPARAEARRSYSRALAQRNALLGRMRAGFASPRSLDAWDAELAAAGVELIATRLAATEALAPEFETAAAELGLGAGASLAYRPHCEATNAERLAAEFRERREADVSRGHTVHGPHLDELELALGGRSLRRYGSQGEQRSGVLAMLFAERRALLEARRWPPLMLLDDVMSELDAGRRALLARRLAEGGGQAVLTATEPEHLPAGCVRAEFALRRGEVVATRALDHLGPVGPSSGEQRVPA
jgi:DNA replication and repair protein RecF